MINCRLSLNRAPKNTSGPWRTRVFFVIAQSMASLNPHRGIMKALMGVMMGDPEYSLFSEATAFSRQRVLGQFERAMMASKDVPKRECVALSHLFYVLHLGLISWWLMDRSEHQRTTNALFSL